MGMKCDIHHLPETTTESELSALIRRLNEDREVNGILVQMPLPRHIDSSKLSKRLLTKRMLTVLALIMPGCCMKTIRGPWWRQRRKAFCIFATASGDLSGKHAVIIGRSNIVGRPLASLLLNHHCTVTVTHSKTVGLPEITRGRPIFCGQLADAREW